MKAKLPLLLALMTLLSLASNSLLAQSESNELPVVTIYTDWESDQEGAIHLSLSGSESDFATTYIDAGYGKKKPTDVDQDGAIPAKGNVIKVYGRFEGIGTPMDITKKIEIAPNDFIKEVNISLTTLEEQPDLTKCQALTRLTMMACELKSIDFDKIPASITTLQVLVNDLSEIVLPSMPNLDELSAGSCPNMSKVDVSGAPNLTRLDIGSSPMLTTLDLSKNPNLIYLAAYDCALSNIDLSHCNSLENISLSGNKLSQLKLGNTEAIEILELANNRLTAIDLAKMPKLKSLSLRANTQVSSIDLSNNPELMILTADSTAIKEIKVNHLKNLETLDLGATQLTKLDISGMPALQNVSIEHCYSVSEINFANAPLLTNILIDGNKLSFDQTAQMAKDLPEADIQMGPFIGVYSQGDPKEGNLMHEEAVELCRSKNYAVMQRDSEGEVSDYNGIPASIDPLTAPKLSYRDTGAQIVIDLSAINKIVSTAYLYSMSGELIRSYELSGGSLEINKKELRQGTHYLIHIEGIGSLILHL